MPIGKTFDNRDVIVDAEEFIGCTFRGGRITYEGGALPTFRNCSFTGCAFALEGPAKRTLEYFGLLQAMGAGGLVDEFLESVKQTADSGE